ncbi:MAG: hypothetical protein K6B68_16560 [Eubacterium sp.]|nr:hypothetical protein [Eubacterium sp.]
MRLFDEMSCAFVAYNYVYNKNKGFFDRAGKATVNYILSTSMGRPIVEAMAADPYVDVQRAVIG